MAQRTRLFQQAGSPLIQGQSRTRRPFWQEWLTGTIAGTIAVVLPGTLWLLLSDVTPGPDLLGWLAGIPGSFMIWLPVMLVAVAAGVGVARGYGLRRPWVPGSILGALTSLVWSYVAASHVLAGLF